MKKEMAEWRIKSSEPGIDQMEEQKDVLQKLEILKSFIGVLQKEVHSLVDQIEELHEELEGKQLRCRQAKYHVEELQGELVKSHVQTEETGKVISKEMEKVKVYMVNYKTLQNQKQSFEKEVMAKNKECDKLRTQLQGLEAGKNQLGKEIQLLKTLL
ncbi:hypothetical protein Y1Q_0016149 [Alligator mississippiensis]|uniref:Uncharacterized protein n=1 Tax=Alligator mississippiensis TaxID=8496 RepID=A0A151P153_ALLMI|nr:hypothetical protein Y1Q_0016149 [Alligator mississippiensis]